MSMITWEYYSSLYNDISEEEFAAAETLAEHKVREQVGPIRWAAITEDDFGYIVLQDCLCNTIHKMQENIRTGSGRGVASVSNDGYSESYTIKTAEEAEAELGKLIRIWLSGTGLIGAY